MSHKKKEIEKTLLLVMKLIRSEGFTADDLISPRTKKSSTPETRTRFNRINEIITLSFEEEVRSLLKANISDLSKEEKERRRYWQQQIGSKRNDIRNSLLGRKHTKNITTVLRNLKSALLIIEKMEKSELMSFDYKTVQSSINSAVASIQERKSYKI